jgi:hypothetical protein
MKNESIITIVHNDDDEFTSYSLDGYASDRLYVVSLLIRSYYYPAYFLNVKNGSASTEFVSVEQQGNDILITAQKEYQRKEQDSFRMSLENYNSMITDWTDRFDGRAEKIFFILTDNQTIDVQSNGLGRSPDE